MVTTTDSIIARPPSTRILTLGVAVLGAAVGASLALAVGLGAVACGAICAIATVL